VTFTGGGTYGGAEIVSTECTATDALSGIDTKRCPDVRGPGYLLPRAPAPCRDGDRQGREHAERLRNVHDPDRRASVGAPSCQSNHVPLLSDGLLVAAVTRSMNST